MTRIIKQLALTMAAVLSFVLPTLAREAGEKLYKCVDAAGGTSYTNQADVEGKKCSLLAWTPEVGDKTTVGLVIEVRPPIAKVQTNKGERWYRIDELKKIKDKYDAFLDGEE